MKDMEALRERIMDMIEEVEDLSGTEYAEVSTELSTLTRAIEQAAWCSL
jgi:hypothetical protein